MTAYLVTCLLFTFLGFNNCGKAKNLLLNSTKLNLVFTKNTIPDGVDYDHPLNLNTKSDLSLLFDDNKGNQILDLSNKELYFDQNKLAKVAYYIPGSMNLIFDWTNGKYDMRILHGISRETDLAINVRLQSSINDFERKLLKHILCKYHNKCTYDLRPVPFEESITLETGLNLFGVEDEGSINTVFTGFDEPLELAFNMSENKMKMFLGSAANGFSPLGSINIRGRQSTVQMDLKNTRTLGSIYFENANLLKYDGFTNTSPYPIKIEQVILFNEDVKKDLIQSKYTVGAIVEPDQSWNISADIGSAIYYHAVDVVIRYQVLPCEVCETKAMERINKTTNISTNYKITIYEAGACEYLEKDFISIEFQDPQKEVVMKRKSYNDEIEVYKLPGSTLEYKYRIIVMNNYGVRKTSVWISSDKPSIYLDEKMITDNFSEY